MFHLLQNTLLDKLLPAHLTHYDIILNVIRRVVWKAKERKKKETSAGKKRESSE